VAVAAAAASALSFSALAIAASAAERAASAFAAAAVATSCLVAAAADLNQQSAALWPLFEQYRHSRKTKELKLKHIHDKMLIGFLIQL